jgi:CubicO group peptidase (beta-lactamase class C family)
MTSTEMAGIGGFVAAGFEPVRDEFERNFAERGELGAAFAVVGDDGAPLVDLWGGLADRASGRPWTADTTQVIFSGSKGLVSICMLILLERGALDLHTPVARYWPEFGQAGKERVLVRDVMAHTTRLPGLAQPVSWREATDARRMARLLAAQPQSADPRAEGAYHPMTFGWLCGELVARVDGRTLGRFFAEEVATPLDLELWIGLPEEQEERVATIEAGPAWSAPAPEGDELASAVLVNPARFAPGAFASNERAWRAAEVPASNAIGTARSIARMYASLDRLLLPETIDLGRHPISLRLDALRTPPIAVSFGVGFQLQTEARSLGPPIDAFGHGGAGGSRHGRWPRQRVGFSYAMNRLADEIGDPRGVVLLDVLHTCLEANGAR